MSQEKVDAYKKEKRNRKELQQKEERNKVLSWLCFTLACGILCMWLGASAYGLYESNRTLKPSVTRIDASSIFNMEDGYMGESTATVEYETEETEELATEEIGEH